ncbi:phytosulfokine receptor 2-like [Triticum dicoccoides]|uniref:phytosulfokine receptor 2-like n=1 Tax=Triticum dicoccoides TaxID=85692 RepID=UPI0018910A1D|nr:phytosulfokine receptor 2-like [Triticum dicoccoides]
MNPMAKCYLMFFLLLAVLLPEARATSCHPDDLRALLDFAGSLNGGGVLLRATWSGATCCSWEGVGCDAASGRVTVLRLPRRGLGGPIPGTSLAGLTQLEELDLGSNNFHNISGVLTMLRGCQNLTTLILTKNFGGEELPGDSIIGGFKSLEVLVLGDCALKGRVPEWLSQCKKMEVLDLSRNQLVGTIPSWIGELHHLSYLDLSNNSLVGEVPKSLARLKGLATAGHSEGMTFTNMPLYVKHNRSTLGRRLNELPNVITGTNNVVRSGRNNVVSGNDNTVIFGDENTVSGNNHAVYGNHNTVSGNNHVVSGSKHVVSGSRHGVTGSSSVVSGFNNGVSGINHVVSGSNNVVSGSNNVVSGMNHIVVGNNKVVSGA